MYLILLILGTPSSVNRGRRKSVFAESYDPSKDTDSEKVSKSPYFCCMCCRLFNFVVMFNKKKKTLIDLQKKKY